ncbi:MAG: SagB/ThcOx family dehydrogenase [Proteobacteria bacterium]|nr:SagB/ThcOx family dehydrogenase [Pseudomonadota bacterium]
MRIRRAATLVCTFEGDKPVIHNFLKKEMFECNVLALEILAALDDWTSMEDALVRLPDPAGAATILRELIQRDLVLTEGSPQAERDQRYRSSWRWGAVAGFYHFGLRDSDFIDAESKLAQLRKYKEEGVSPPLLTSNEGLEKVYELDSVDLDDSFFATLYKRRSVREYSTKPISSDDLAACLYAGNGLKEILDAGEFGRLPLTMTPSGGGRNPFELYVWARNVTRIESGFYHYSAIDHSLGYVGDTGQRPADLLGNQAWTNDAAAVVFLCATFERSAWKYRQALAYRVVLMEAGAITQNLQLAAVHRGIAAAPTGALSESVIERQLGLADIEQAALLAVTLGNPA